MKILIRSIIILLCISLYMPLTKAQSVMISTELEQVRFTAQKTAEMQLQIFDQAGQIVYDSGAVTGSELTWTLREASVKSGLYTYTLSVKEEGVETVRVQRGHFIVDRAREGDGKADRLLVTIHNDSGAGAESTAANNEGVTIAGASEHESVNNFVSKPKNKNNAPMAELVSGTTGQIAKFTSATDVGNSVMTELNNNIGIGTTSPISKLHILSGVSDYLPPRLQSSGTNTFAAGWDLYHGSTGVGYVGVPDPSAAIAPGEMLLYGVGTTSLWAGRQRSVTIAPDGRVGIGAINPFPAVRLYVQRNGDTALLGSNPTGTAVAGSTDSGDAVVGTAGPNGNAGSFWGNVKIRGNLVPADFGMFDIGFPDTGRWRHIYAYTIHVDNVYQTSDARLKKGITNLSYGLRELMQLRPVSYEWKEKNDGQKHLGLIAQETEQIIPEAVKHGDNPDATLSINYTTLIPVLIKSIQEQQSAMTTLKNENEALQEKLRVLEQKVQQLTKQ